uniref:RNase-Cwar1 n=1 Tax=Caribicus warreni TaxID=865857 RepID=E2E4K1_CARWR|nr:RNase-Cwar1 [Caribicus warreni]
MAAKGPCLLWLFLLFTCMTVRTEADHDFEYFQKHHVDFPKPGTWNDDVYCRMILYKRCIGFGLEWTYIIHATEEQLKAICTVDGKRLTGAYRNLTPLPLASCYDTNNDYAFHGESLTGIFEVQCKDGLPVTFLKFIK